MILVTTTGKVGSETVRLLAREGIPVRTISRHPESAAELVNAGAEVLLGDLEDRESIDRAMEGVDTVVLVTLAIPKQELAVIDSATRTGVNHVVKASSKASLDSPIARRRWQSEIEAGLLASGLNHTILRSNAYMQNTLMLAPLLAKTSAFASSAGAGRIGMVDARDVAAVAATIATSPGEHVNQTYWLTGPDLVSNYDVADVLSKLLHRPIAYRTQSFEEDKQTMILAGVPEAIAEMNAQAFSLVSEGDAEWLSTEVPTLLGRPAHSYEEFAQDHLSTFS